MQPLMLPIKFPLAGDVIQAITASFLNPTNSQFGMINISLGQSSAPAVEQQVLDQVGSYGRQLGRIGEALSVLIKHFDPKTPLPEAEQEAIVALKIMLGEIADIKEQYKREAVRP